MATQYYVVDAFANEPFTGNPAAVILDSRGLTDQRMQAIAAEFNLSETTFVDPLGSDLPDAPLEPPEEDRPAYNFRWFTPTAEVDMCGHATVAAIHALGESGQLHVPNGEASTSFQIDTRSGILTAYVEPIEASDRSMIWLDLPDPVLSRSDLAASELAAALRLEADAVEQPLPIVTTQDRDAIFFVRNVAVLNEAKPRLDELADLLRGHELRGLCVATVSTLTPSINVQSRFFAPTVGISEDPVTGSVHGPLAAYLVRHDLVAVHDGLAAITCTQGIPGGRTGILYALAQPGDTGACSVRIGGQAITTMRGDLMA